MNSGMRQPPKYLRMAEMLSIAEERRNVVEENELIKLHQTKMYCQQN
jgi:hypothetical protein